MVQLLIPKTERESFVLKTESGVKVRGSVDDARKATEEAVRKIKVLDLDKNNRIITGKELSRQELNEVMTGLREIAERFDGASNS